jgi:hypothetical protein
VIVKRILQGLSLVGLGLTVIPSLLVFRGVISLETHHLLMAAGMLIWFVSAPFWLRKRSSSG